jgi:sugar/nucleoside kinase (ribokinase family)
MQSWEVDECIKYANMIAAMQCTKLGNHSAIPTKEEIEKFQKAGEVKEVKLEDLGVR